jgi:hypothetical protein
MLIQRLQTSWKQLDNYNFKQYTQEFGKRYDDAEYNERETIFLSRLEKIRLHNRGDATWKLGVNQFTDLTETERSKLLGLDRSRFFNELVENDHARAAISDRKVIKTGMKLPHRVDWRDAGVVTAVKDQGECGSCWTFGTTETIESSLALKTGFLFDLSEQQVTFSPLPASLTAHLHACLDSRLHCEYQWSAPLLARCVLRTRVIACLRRVRVLTLLRRLRWRRWMRRRNSRACDEPNHRDGRSNFGMDVRFRCCGDADARRYPYQSYPGNNFDSCRFNSSYMK